MCNANQEENDGLVKSLNRAKTAVQDAEDARAVLYGLKIPSHSECK